MDPSIRITIIDGGLAETSMIHALGKFSHLDVHIFEAAPEFREAGMASGSPETHRSLWSSSALRPSNVLTKLESAGSVSRELCTAWTCYAHCLLTSHRNGRTFPRSSKRSTGIVQLTSTSPTGPPSNAISSSVPMAFTVQYGSLSWARMNS